MRQARPLSLHRTRRGAPSHRVAKLGGAALPSHEAAEATTDVPRNGKASMETDDVVQMAAAHEEAGEFGALYALVDGWLGGHPECLASSFDLDIVQPGELLGIVTVQTLIVDSVLEGRDIEDGWKNTSHATKGSRTRSTVPISSCLLKGPA